MFAFYLKVWFGPGIRVMFSFLVKFLFVLFSDFIVVVFVLFSLLLGCCCCLPFVVVIVFFVFFSQFHSIFYFRFRFLLCFLAELLPHLPHMLLLR